MKMPIRMTEVCAGQKGHRGEASKAERLIIFSHVMSVEPETPTAAVKRSLRIDPRVPLMAGVTGVDSAAIILV